MAHVNISTGHSVKEAEQAEGLLNQFSTNVKCAVGDGIVVHGEISDKDVIVFWEKADGKFDYVVASPVPRR